MSLVKEFKAFAMRGNVVDLAVGVIIGAAFGKIISSFVADIVMPLLSLFVGGVDFTSMKYVLTEAQGDVPGASLAYGNFLQMLFDFIIVAFAIFMAVKAINSMKRKEEAAAPAAPPKQEVLLGEIRDLLKK